ncbi:MAG: hypothetical protein MSG64_06885 [Pyrinomonadaceae bacterium MAG19_C2-C3]|nr:hypothetical protein [Pyrinomonadaceae bacterium MAG19_C2-C3]
MMKPILLRVAVALLTFMLGISAAFVAGIGVAKNETNPACKRGYHRVGCAHRSADVPSTPRGCRTSSYRY